MTQVDLPVHSPETQAKPDDESGEELNTTNDAVTASTETVATLRALDSTKDLPANPKEGEGYQIHNVYWVWTKGHWVSRTGIYGFEAYDTAIGNESSRVKSFDAMYPDPASGTPKRIVIGGFDTTNNPARDDTDATTELVILMQNGTIPEVGQNGVTLEDLIRAAKIVVDGYQASPFACEENERIRFHLESALQVCKARTARRQAEGTEGTHVGN